jgi:hypothetical protein
MKTAKKKSVYMSLWIIFAAAALSTTAYWFHPATIQNHNIILLWIGFFALAGIIVTSDYENPPN